MGTPNGEEERTRDLLSNLQNGRADGALLLNGQLPLLPHEKEDLAIVSMSEEIPGANIPHVGTDSVAGTFDATNHLIDLGHRYIFHFSGPDGNMLTSERRLGYESAMHAAGLKDLVKVVSCGFMLEDGQAAAARLMDADTKPDAIVCASDIEAMGTIFELNRQGYVVPRDTSVLGFEDITFASVFSPPLTTIQQNRREIGRRAASMLLGLIQGAQEGPDKVLVEHTLIQRQSAVQRA